MNKNSHHVRKISTEKISNIRETTTSIETSEEIKYLYSQKDFRFKSKQYTISILPNKEIFELDSYTNIILQDYSLKTIFKMAQIKNSNFSDYLTFSITFEETEFIKNPKKEVILDYKLFLKLIDSLYINFGQNNEDMPISQISIEKIFDMLDIPTNDRTKYIQFYEVEEKELTEIKNKKVPQQQKIETSKRNEINEIKKINKVNKINKINNNKNNIKIKYVSGPSNLSYKFLPSSLDNIKDVLDNINIRPDVSKLRSKKPKQKNLNKNDYLSKLTELEKIIKTVKKVPGDEDDEDLGTKVPYIESELSELPIKNERIFPFLLRKLAEYENYPMYLIGSIEKLGKWNVKHAIPMDEELRNDHIFYSKYVDLKKDEFPFEYKYFYIKNKQPIFIGLGNSDKNFICHPQFFHLYHKIQKNHISIYDLNIRYLNIIDEKNLWNFRKNKLIQSILNSYVDILFFQEITRTQYEYIEHNLASVYEFVGIYRDTTDVSEKCPISYNRFKYTLNDWGQFWLSSTPNEPCSNDFIQFFPRICTWCCLKQINGIDLIFFNTHLDHANFLSHIRAINVILEEIPKILGIFPYCKFVFLGGCFYCEDDDEVIIKIKDNGFNEVVYGNTFHDFTGEADRHWDYLFWKNVNNYDNVRLELKGAYVNKKDGTVDENNKVYISDHFPVIAQFELNGC